MFAVRRIFRNAKPLSNYICTSGVVKCDETNKKEPKLGATKPQEGNVEKKKREKSKTGVVNDILSDLRPVKRGKEVRETKTKFQKDLISSAENVASELGGDKEKTKKDLLEYVKTLEVTKRSEDVQERRSFNRSIRDPKIGRYQAIPKSNKQYTMPEKEKKDQEKRTQEKKEQDLNIFQETIMQQEDSVKLKIWDDLKAEELAFLSKIEPRNYYDELIQWTKEGKLWKFPIDNDQGLDEEAATSFTEHVFLEKHLKPWCPEKGPLRKFMNMVLIGLSKNPHLSVAEKKSHIKWFEDYFERKRKLLQELGAIGPKKLEASEQEQKS